MYLALREIGGSCLGTFPPAPYRIESEVPLRAWSTAWLIALSHLVWNRKRFTTEFSQQLSLHRIYNHLYSAQCWKWEHCYYRTPSCRKASVSMNTFGLQEDRKTPSHHWSHAKTLDVPTFSCGVEETRTNCSSGVVIFNPFLHGRGKKYSNPLKFHPEKGKAA